MRVAAVQAAPAYLDRAATLDVVIQQLHAAAEAGAVLVAFPETFVPGYPSWVDITHASHFDDPVQHAAFARYLDQAVDIERGDLDAVVATCRDLAVFAYLGVYERSRSGGSGYCSLVAIDPTAGIVGVHRKLKPTFGERLVWADGDGAGLLVHEHEGVRVSGLNCWENWMPLARTAMYAQGTQIHVATWPGSPGTSHDVSRFIAKEGRMFVVSSGAVLRAEHLPDDFSLRDDMLAVGNVYATGGTIIVGPDGGTIAEAPVGEAALLVADLDLDEVRRARHDFDPTGHYSRPDVFEVAVDRRRRSTITVTE